MLSGCWLPQKSVPVNINRQLDSITLAIISNYFQSLARYNPRVLPVTTFTVIYLDSHRNEWVKISPVEPG